MLKGLIVGFGSIAEGHLQGYLATEGMEAVAVVDLSPQRREAARCLGLQAFTSVEVALDSVHIDFVDLCTPPSTHLDGIRACIKAGVPVMCEKPVFVPGDSTFDDVLAHVWSGGSLVYPCQNYKFAPVFSRVREILESGEVGVIQHARVDIARNGHARGVVEWRPDWRRDPAYSAGGILRDHGPHAFYLLLSLVGALPKEISVVMGSLTPAQGLMPTEDTALVRFHCGEGIKCDVSLTWAADNRSSRYMFAGTAGFISIDNDVLTWANGGRVVREPIRSGFDDPSHSAWFGAMFADFGRLLRLGAAGVPERIDLVSESLHTTAMIDAGYESALASGTWKPVPDLRPRATWNEDTQTA